MWREKKKVSVFRKARSAESHTAEQPQNRATSGPPCIHFTARALINYQTSTVTVTVAAARLTPTPLPNKPDFVLSASVCQRTEWGTFLSLYTNFEGTYFGKVSFINFQQ